MARYGVIHENLLFEIMVSSYCIVFRGVHKCKTVTANNIDHGLYFSNPGSYKPGLVHCSKTQTKPHQNRGSDQVYTDQVSAWFNGGLNHGLDHCSKIGPICLCETWIKPSEHGLIQKNIDDHVISRDTHLAGHTVV